MSLVPALDSLLTPLRQAIPPMGLPVAFGLLFLLDFTTSEPEQKKTDLGDRDDSDLEELFIQPQAKASCIARHGSYLSRTSSFVSLDDSDRDDEGEFDIDEPIYFEPRKRRHTI
ncbi:hypothetical protein SCHPADRAFT_899482 [Schizopora paradoxa]|uniref:Uncharacterized protein n=1 Tax=Schizopora paradoxa TaxID=27342 RepID=A0A0H2SNP5_9AGAM|nr:hypothetical protein SCHPADRAFT_899482 [Schizopora paradoxa]